MLAKWRQTECGHRYRAYNRLRNKIHRCIKDRKSWYNQFVLSKLDSLSTSRPDFWKRVKDLLGKCPSSNAPLIHGDTVYYDMTSKAKIFNEYVTSISTAPDSILKYFLGLSEVLPRLSEVLPRFHMYTDLCIPPLSVEPLDVYHVQYYCLLIPKSNGFAIFLTS